jgi:hypothetical protein
MTNTATSYVEDNLTLQFKQLMTTGGGGGEQLTEQQGNSSPNGGSGMEELLIAHGLKSSAAAVAAAASQNITESVPVPSSEHVAEIVGRQGCKIKALRAKTNTYIKTPVRGEAPMFTITGRREDVLVAKREIQLAADHFSQIRARRGSNSSSTGCNGEALCESVGGLMGAGVDLVNGISSLMNAINTTSPKLIINQGTH